MKGPFDAGLQAERTALAWKRTGLAMAVNALLVIKTGIQHDRSLLCAGVALAVVACCFVAVGELRRRSLLQGPPSSESGSLMVSTSVLSALAAIAALWSMLTFP